MQSLVEDPLQNSHMNSAAKPVSVSQRLLAASVLVDMLGIKNFALCCGLEETSPIVQRLFLSKRVRQRICALCCDYFDLGHPTTDENILRILFLLHYKNNIVETMCEAIGLAMLLNSHGPILLKSDLKTFVERYGEKTVNFAVKQRMDVEPIESSLAHDAQSQKTLLIENGVAYFQEWLMQNLPDIAQFITLPTSSIIRPITLSSALNTAILSFVGQVVGYSFVQDAPASITNRLRGLSA